MVQYEANWAMSLFLTDNLNHAKIPFKLFVISTGKVIFEFDDADAERVAGMCKGLAKQI